MTINEIMGAVVYIKRQLTELENLHAAHTSIAHRCGTGSTEAMQLIEDTANCIYGDLLEYIGDTLTEE